ncbi:MAG: hypothetical protein WC421_02620 [Elusimicrobiales bacterium]
MKINLPVFLSTVKSKLDGGKPFVIAVQETARELYPENPAAAADAALEEVSRLLQVPPVIVMLRGEKVVTAALEALNGGGAAAAEAPAAQNTAYPDHPVDPADDNDQEYAPPARRAPDTRERDGAMDPQNTSLKPDGGGGRLFLAIIIAAIAAIAWFHFR